ncbi:dihydrodipicolinate synthase family protein [Ruegeria atlantica]|uniref:L-2-keto-3-deoxyarabonate dehydratase n=1 Tax=Ruegeria atlantica TaxID=81569 RepID=A0A0N7LNK9_9RHOB|nr:dihydrodipicolinate synthase family protein [Ruegeria atlantica]CUH42708.1 L-2-keto-3-deoxyarabonate dehydratase [Ruegeria atlantica]
MSRTYTGIWPVAPTPFNPDGSLDLEGMKRVLDCLIEQGADGICILANFSEQFLISDAEREVLARLSVEHIAGRVPVIVTISHYATQIAVERAQFAKDLGADIVMMMPPYHGALLKGTPEQSFEQFEAVGKVGIPIMVQDAPLSGVDLPVPLLVRMAKEIESVKLFKIECPRAANKIRALIEQGSEAIEAPFDGEEAITLLADLDAGATGSMTSGMIVDQIKPVLTHHYAGRIDDATSAYGRVAMAINHENRQCGWQSCKAAMVEGGVIKSEFCRHPIPPLHPAIRSRLIDLLKPLDPMVLKWGK